MNNSMVMFIFSVFFFERKYFWTFAPKIKLFAEAEI